MLFWFTMWHVAIVATVVLLLTAPGLFLGALAIGLVLSTLHLIYVWLNDTR